MAEDFSCFLSSYALSRVKFPVKTDLVSVPRNRSGSSAWSVEHKQRVWEGVGQVAKGRSWETLAPLVRVLNGPAEDRGHTPVLTSCAKDGICRPVYSGVGGSSSPCIRFAETKHKLSGLHFILLQTQFFSRA